MIRSLWSEVIGPMEAQIGFLLLTYPKNTVVLSWQATAPPINHLSYLLDSIWRSSSSSDLRLANLRVYARFFAQASALVPMLYHFGLRFWLESTHLVGMQLAGMSRSLILKLVQEALTVSNLDGRRSPRSLLYLPNLTCWKFSLCLALGNIRCGIRWGSRVRYVRLGL